MRKFFILQEFIECFKRHFKRILSDSERSLCSRSLWQDMNVLVALTCFSFV